MKTKLILSVLLVASLVVLSGCGCKPPSSQRYSMTLEVWGPLDDSYTYQDIFETYKKINPNIKGVTYRKFSTDTYKKELLDALASGQGPDVFLINNTWLPSFEDKIMPAPSTVLGEQKYRQDFVDVVANDFIDKNGIWAAPLSVDSIGLYYNKDLFNEAGITNPPQDWTQFQEDVVRLTKLSPSREILQSGAAIGTAYNINRSTDVLNLMMLQSGTQMADEYGNITMGDGKQLNGEIYIPAQKALNFYTQFASTNSPYYTWNSRQHYSIDAFSEGTLAMMLNYSWHIQTIRDKSPRLNFAVAPVPQVPGTTPINFANYWAFAVAKNKISQEVTNETRVAEAWKLIKFLTTKPEGNWNVQSGLGVNVKPDYDPSADYLAKTNKPAARRDLVDKQLNDPILGAFAKGNLITKSWKENDPEGIETALAEMINQINLGQATADNAIKTAVQRITQFSN